jgi:hypothetical protein
MHEHFTAVFKKLYCLTEESEAENDIYSCLLRKRSCIQLGSLQNASIGFDEFAT